MSVIVTVVAVTVVGSVLLVALVFFEKLNREVNLIFELFMVFIANLGFNTQDYSRQGST